MTVTEDYDDGSPAASGRRRRTGDVKDRLLGLTLL